MPEGVSRRGGSWRARYRHPELGTEHQRTFPGRPGQRWLRQELERVESGRGWTAGLGRSLGAVLRVVGCTAGVDAQHPRGDVAGGPVDPFGGMPLRAIRTTSHRDVGEVDDGQPTPDRRRWRPARSRPGSSTSARCSGPRSGIGDRRRPTDGSGFPGSEARRGAQHPFSRRGRPLPGGRRGAVPRVHRVCALAGLRLGEAAALQFGDVDYDGRLLQVRRQVQRAGGKTVEIRLPKYGSERAVPMPEELAAILRPHEDLGHLTEWMFAGGEPDPPHQNTVGARWRATLKRAGLDGIRLHDLRHFYASGLIADGCDVVTVQRALGTPRRAPRLTPTQSSGLRGGPNQKGRLEPRPAGARPVAVRREMRAR